MTRLEDVRPHVLPCYLHGSLARWFAMLGATAAFALVLVPAGEARAQMRGPGGGQQQQRPTQTSPTQNRSVGPRSGGGDDEPQTTVTQHGGEPIPQPPADPLAVSPEVQSRIGTDYAGGAPAPVGELQRSYFPYYQEQRGDYRFRFLPPLWLEHTRGIKTANPVPGEPMREDRQSLYGLLYYQRRSPDFDADILFPAIWHIRDHDSRTLVLGPIAHREAPGEHDNWLAPIVFEGERKDGGYFHSPALLTTSHWSPEGAFTLAGPYFRHRTAGDIDWGVAPLVFHGDNGNVDGARRTYTLIPPLLFFHRETELDESRFTVAGPVIVSTGPKRSILDVAPLFFHIKGHPETGGVREEHTTLFPFFHYGYKEDESLFIVPGYMHRATKSTNTTITPFFSQANTRNGATTLTAVGPILPLYWNYRDKDVGASAWAALPFYYQYDSPTGHDFLTPLFGRFETYGVSKSYWLFPTFSYATDKEGWDAALHPIVYIGRHHRSEDDHNSHAVVAPIYWDFASAKGRTTIGFPLFWRFSDTVEQSVTQVAGNTVYIQKRVPGGTDWQFHFAPLFSYGEDPQGYFWNILFGLAGYQREGGYSRIRAFWVPITIGAPKEPAKAAAR